MKLKLVPFLIVLATAVIIAQLFLLSTPTPVTALPPRPTATAVPAPTIPGAKITLHAAGPISPDNWTVVQWQDAQGKWHDVTGWQGELEADHTKTWWVGVEHLGSGPFRWLVLTEDEVVGSSAAFYLPTNQQQELRVEVTVK